jgi:hypothetical protein
LCERLLPSCVVHASPPLPSPPLPSPPLPSPPPNPWCAQDRADSLKRRVNLAKGQPLEQWTVADLCAWLEVGIGMGQYCRAVQVAVPAGVIAPAKVLADLDERALASKVRALGRWCSPPLHSRGAFGRSRVCSLWRAWWKHGGTTGSRPVRYWAVVPLSRCPVPGLGWAVLGCVRVFAQFSFGSATRCTAPDCTRPCSA